MTLGTGPAADWPSETKMMLDMERVATQFEVGSFMRDSLQIEGALQVETGRRLASMEAYVLTETVAEESKRVSFKAPATWWEHLKEDLYLRRVGARKSHWWEIERLLWYRFLSWAYFHHPVRYTTEHQMVTFTAKARYPYATVPWPGLGKPVIYEAYDVRPDGGPWSPRNGRPA